MMRMPDDWIVSQALCRPCRGLRVVGGFIDPALTDGANM